MLSAREEMVEAWIEYLGGEPVPFPREVGTYYVPENEPILAGWYPRQTVEDEDDYLGYLGRKWLKDTVVAANSMPHFEAREVSRLKGEVGDSSYLHVAYLHARTIAAGLAKLGIYAQWIFTGGRSFHVHIPFRTYKLKTTRYNVPIIVFKSLIGDVKKIMRWRGEFDIDWKVVGDFRRLMRPPYVLKMKTLIKRRQRMFSVPVDLCEQTLIDVERASRRCSLDYDFRLREADNYHIRSMVKSTDRLLHKCETEVGRMIESYEPPKKKLRDKKYKELIRTVLTVAPRVRDGRHRILYHLLVPALRWDGYTLEEALSVAQKFLEGTGASFELYKHMVEYWFLREDGNGNPFKPMRLSRFLQEYPELSYIFKGGR